MMRQKSKFSRLERLVLALCVGLLALTIGLYSFQALSPENSEHRSSLGGDFTLQHLDGPVSLTDFRGQAVILMFGYTSCPDVCPSGLANLAAAIARLSSQQQQQLQPLFISVDPDRDDLDRLQKYSHYFHPKMLGLTADKGYLDNLVRNYGAFYRKVEMPDSALAYSIDHTARIYLINRQGQLVTQLHHNTAVNRIKQALTKLIEAP